MTTEADRLPHQPSPPTPAGPPGHSPPLPGDDDAPAGDPPDWTAPWSARATFFVLTNDSEVAVV
jgi:hypothetical protein